MPRLLLLLALALTAGCESDRAGDLPVYQMEIPFRKEGVAELLRADGTAIVRLDIEIAETAEERARGLMQRRSLPPLSGMLFIDRQERVQEFWMKNTPLSLDMIFADREGRIVRIAERTTPLSTATVSSVEPALYVLEVRAGFADRYDLRPGDRMRWERAE